MSTRASRVFGEGFLSGFFDMVTTMVGGKATFQLGGIEDLSSDRFAGIVSQYGGVIHAVVQGSGGIALLMPASDLYSISATLLGEEPVAKDFLAPDDASALKEVYEPCLGAGASFFKEKYGKVIVLQAVQVVPAGPGAEKDLASLFGGSALSAAFTYSVPPAIQGEGLLLFAGILEQIIPSEVTNMETSGMLGRDEVNNILGTVGIPAAPDAAPPANAPKPAELPPNLDMVLDIRLEVKARMGRVDMPIGEVLALGPGSIIDVGHNVEEPVELLVNDKLIARGDVVVVDDKFGLRITEIISPKERIESLR